MDYFSGITWTQIILIEVGALFQFIALCTFVRQTSFYRHRKSSKLVTPTVNDQEALYAEQATTLRAIQAGPMPHHAPTHEESHPPLHAADLVKTAKVKFKQSFKFRD